METFQWINENSECIINVYVLVTMKMLIMLATPHVNIQKLHWFSLRGGGRVCVYVVDVIHSIF